LIAGYRQAHALVIHGKRPIASAADPQALINTNGGQLIRGGGCRGQRVESFRNKRREKAE